MQCIGFLAKLSGSMAIDGFWPVVSLSMQILVDCKSYCS